MQIYDEYQQKIFDELMQRWSHMRPFITRGEAATILNVSYSTITRLIKDGAFRQGGVRRSLRLRKEDVIDYYVSTFVYEE